MAIKSESTPAYGPTEFGCAPPLPSRKWTSADQTLLDAQAILRERLRSPGEAITSPETTKAYLTLKLAESEYEVFCVLFLDQRHRVIDYQEMFRGTIDGASVYPREVAKEALACNAAAVILAHNHPSGVPEPSTADERITKRLQDALALFDIRVLDHLIVGGLDTVSFAERGLM